MITTEQFNNAVSHIIDTRHWLSRDEVRKVVIKGFNQYANMTRNERIEMLLDMKIKLYWMWDEERDVRDAMYDRIDWMEMFCSQDEVQRARAQYGRIAEKLDADIRWMLDPGQPEPVSDDIPF